MNRLRCELPPEHNISRGLKRWLRKFARQASGITWMAVRGDEPIRIMNRAGHENIPTTQTYIRAAEAIREGFGEMFPPLPQVLFARPESPA